VCSGKIAEIGLDIIQKFGKAVDDGLMRTGCSTKGRKHCIKTSKDLRSDERAVRDESECESSIQGGGQGGNTLSGR
jgi:hypothetical protein